jgi:hypothetical protein
MNIYIPVSIYRVKYQVAKGRPYSAFERTLLEATAEDMGTLDRLVELLQVNRSIVIHGIVTLMQAGWVALTTQQQDTKYVITKLGRRALTTPETLPNSRSILPDRKSKVIMERCWRNVCSSNDLTYISKGLLKKRKEEGELLIMLRAVTSVDPDAAECLPFLSRRKEEFERILDVGPIDLDRHDADFAQVHVNLRDNRITGLPLHWNRDTRLIADIVQKAEEASTEDGVGECRDVLRFQRLSLDVGRLDNLDDKDLMTVTGSTHVASCSISEFRTIKGQKSHQEYLNRVLNGLNEAKSFIVINSYAISDAGVRQLLPALEKALIRGLNVDIFWCNGHESQDAIVKLTELEKASFSSVPGRLMVDRTSSRLRQNVLLADPKGRLEAVLGSHVWLDDEYSYITTSILIRNSQLLAEMCLFISSRLYTSQHMQSSFNSSRLRYQAAEVLQIERETAFNGECQLLIDHHYSNALLREMQTATPESTCIVNCFSLPDELDPFLLDQVANWCVKNRFQLWYHSSCSDSVALKKLEKTGVDIRRSPYRKENHIILGSDTIIIGSWEWLSKTSRCGRNSTRDFGLAIRFPGASQLFETDNE